MALIPNPNFNSDDGLASLPLSAPISLAPSASPLLLASFPPRSTTPSVNSSAHVAGTTGQTFANKITSAIPSSGLQRKGPPLQSRLLDQRRGPPFRSHPSDCLPFSAIVSADPSIAAIVAESHDTVSTLSFVDTPADSTNFDAPHHPLPDPTPSTNASTFSIPNNHHLTATSTTDNATIPTLPPPHTSTPPTKPMPESLDQGPANNTAETPCLLYSPPPVDVTLPPSFTACPLNLEEAAIGSLTVENDDSNSTDAQLAPEYSRTTLEYYNDIDNYLKLSGVNETKKKKKKKKKKTTNSGSNSSTTSSDQPSDTLNTPEHLLPSLPVDVPAAAIGALTVMDDEALATLKRQDDPRYRPIEDSERGDSEIFLSCLDTN
ncbi:hypothetical protein PGT21_008809 [Puccinia graminis f. sp. tritici]|uniref:Uncharacterized protein n=1 Tax=Puccinia graminis f. sp. tritici TaxID=56615 RepID=A0A5B0LRC4_PUCGR|nr:hypothetical protein PGT21_008809 [Puccinia graminis f. sp. tritici]